jgi:hypothetical protein
MDAGRSPSPALSWLLTAGFRTLATKLAHLSLRKAQQIAANPFVLVKRRELISNRRTWCIVGRMAILGS